MIGKLVGTSNIEDTIVIAGSPRSGTTWLGSLVGQLVGYHHRDEPLDLRNAPALREAGFEWRIYLAPHASHPSHYTILHNILEDRAPNGDWNYKPIARVSEFLHQMFQNKLVVKFIRANRMLRWMANTFSARGILLLIRHPCAVISSQLRYEEKPWKDAEVPSDVTTGFGGTLPDFALERFGDILSSLETTEEALAASWCLDQYFPLYEERAPFPGLIVPYEKLLLDGHSELRRIFDYLDADLPAAVKAEFSRPSTSASDDLRTKDARAQLEKWTHQLSNRQIDNILRVVHAFEIDIYSRDPEPDYDALLS
jgi:hypothetical protein